MQETVLIRETFTTQDNLFKLRQGSCVVSQTAAV